jgi:hypothetical protein
MRQVHADFLYGSPIVGLFLIACCILCGLIPMSLDFGVLGYV